MKGLIMRFLPFLTRLFTGVFAGFVGLAVIVWFAGRYVGLTSVTSRLIVIAGLFGIYLLWIIGRALFLKFRGQKLAGDLEQSVEDEELRSKLKTVLDSLKTSQLGRRYRGKGALYALPWYMIIGPSAAGKSTFYARSGLNFPFQDDTRYHMDGIGGTKNCDWWFSDQAVLIDTAGRYSTDEDNKEWFSFLRLLKKHRPQVPVNGVILAFPVDELLTSDPESLQQSANNAKNRLQEVMSELGLMVPVYVVLTKCDMVRGFDAFFEDLSDTEAAQPWGVYVLDQTEDKRTDVVNVLKSQLAQLTERLYEQRTQKMLLANDSDKRNGIFQYPSQFSGLSERLVEFIGMLTKDSPYHEKPWFAGVYFTSSMQEGAVIERRSNLLKDVFAKALGLTERSGSSQRSYFIAELFTQVIFPLKNAVRGSRKRQRLHLAAKSLLLVSFVGLATVSGLTLTGTYTANNKLLSDYVNKAEQLAEQLQTSTASEIERATALIELHQHYQDLESIHTYSPLSLLSRYDLIGTHGEPMRHLLVQSVDQAMRTQVMPFYQTQFEQMSEQWPTLDDQQQAAARHEYYQLLEIYQMLTTQPDEYDRDVVGPYLTDLWTAYLDEQNQPMSASQSDSLNALTGFYLQHVVETVAGDRTDYWHFNDRLIAEGQQALQTPPDADLLYQQMLSKGSNQYPTVTLRSLLGPEVDGVLTNNTEFSELYTRSAWDNYVKAEINALAQAASRGDWVLGLELNNVSDADVKKKAETLKQAIRKQYFSDYVVQWSDLVSKTAAVRHSDLTRSIQSLKAISETDGVLMRLFLTLDENLQISDIDRPELPEQASAEGSDTTTVDLPEPPLNPVFAGLSQELRALIKDTDDSGRPDVLEAYIAEIAPLADELDVIRVASDADQEARRYAGDLLSGQGSGNRLYSAWINVDNLLQGTDDVVKGQMSPLLTSPLRAVWNGMLAASERSLQTAWQETVYGAYRKSIQGRFPFADSSSDAVVRDVTAFFQPEAGVFWQFINTDLKPFVQVRSGNWKVRTWLGQGLAFNPDVFNAVNSAGSIVTGLFDEQSNTGMKYWVSPIPTPGVSESRLAVDNHTYRYRNEPEEWREFYWSLESSQMAQVEVHLNGGSGYADLKFEGPWAFVRLLRHSDIAHERGTEFKVSFPLTLANGETVSARYSVRADRAGSVLNKSALQGFYLPSSLFKG
ncbi:hypothetical protein MED297_18448 [Reinekea sp. MED297]|uniref:IcmF-related protein n=2 Tax=Reinekea TaxID=230494 RepID=A4BEW1_9GAMM|nr:hypothetical protein MED297_18448 [Reinekea sp. MED297] [Reinekea blandensis MED297]